MTDEQQEWPTHCEHCGTELESAVVDFDKSNADRPEMRPGEMVAVDYCPNEDCPSRQQDTPSSVPESVAGSAPGSAPGSLGGDNGGG